MFIFFQHFSLDNDRTLISFTFVHTFKPFPFKPISWLQYQGCNHNEQRHIWFFGESLHLILIFHHQVIPISLLLAKAYTGGPKLTWSCFLPKKYYNWCLAQETEKLASRKALAIRGRGINSYLYFQFKITNTFRVSEGLSVNDPFQKSILTPYRTLSNTGVWGKPGQTMHWSAWSSLLHGQFCLKVQLSTVSVLDCSSFGDAAPSTGGPDPSLATRASHCTT